MEKRLLLCYVLCQICTAMPTSREGPFQASLSGPLITTIDGQSYMFTGHGEYEYLDVDNGQLKIQARAERVSVGAVDKVIFDAFVLKDYVHNDSLYVLLNKTDGAIYVYLNNGSLWHTSTSCVGPPIETAGFMLFCIPNENQMMIRFRERLQDLASIKFTGGESLKCSFEKRHNMGRPVTSGLAGALVNRTFIGRNGSTSGIGSSEDRMWKFSKSWALRTESESLFNYGLTNGNFSYYNDNHVLLNNQCKIKQCYQNITCDVHSMDDNPCGPCPAGMRNEMVLNKQNCIGSIIHVQDTISVSCTDSGWNIDIDTAALRTLYPGLAVADIYLGEKTCTGVVSGDVLMFRQGLSECHTLQARNSSLFSYNNDVVYIVNDPSLPSFITREYWRVRAECDVPRNMTSLGHIHHIGDTGLHVTGNGHYDVNMTFYKDVNFIEPVHGNPITVVVGSKVYVKVVTLVTDWSMKMRVHTCYTKPSPNAPDSLKYYIIKDGCELDDRTHFIFQSTHETRFVFQDFEYSNEHDELYVFCDAVFCNDADRSTNCLQQCNHATGI